MKIAISGASGYIGRHLTTFFEGKGYEIVSLDRNLFKEEQFSLLCRRVAQCDVVLNLAGAPINKRWTNAYKQELYNSRIGVTRQLVRAINANEIMPRLFISISAVGYYSSVGEYDEYNAEQGDTFLARLCSDWEEAARTCSSGVRLVIARLGVVLSTDGGALEQMLRMQRLSRMGVVIGSGKQGFPWISMADLCRSFDFVIQEPHLQGVINMVSPQCITQKHLAVVLAKAYSIRRILSFPSCFFRLLLGEGASFLTEGQIVHPTKLLGFGFNYVYSTIEKMMHIADYQTIPKLDVSRYMGRWYEIARFENRFERGMTHVQATYTLQSDGKISVLNEGLKDGVLKKAHGKGKQPDPDNNPGKLKVAFFWRFYSDYYIFELDENYQYALVGSSSDKYLWILSRSKELSDTVREYLIGKIKERGFDTSKLLFTAQD